MLGRKRSCAWFVMLALLAVVAGCGDDDDEERPEAAVEGTFVGKLSGTEALVAVVASPAARGQDRRDVMVYVSDGERVSESYVGSAQGNEFTARSEGDEAEAKGTLSGDSAAGTIELPDGETARYTAAQATATSGLYDLTVSARGKLSGASAAGVGLTSRAGLEAPGTGTLRFADGKRRRFRITSDEADRPVRLRAGEVRLIVLPDGDMSGAEAGGDDPEYFIRSAA